MAKIKHATLIEEFEDTKWVIWGCKSKKDRKHNGQNKTCHIVCPSLTYSFRLPIWYLQTLLSMWHVLFWPLCCLSFFDLQPKHATLIEEFDDTKWVIWSCKSKNDRKHNGQNKTCHIDWTASDYPFGIVKLFYQCGMFYFGHCVFCPSLTYSFRLPIWYLQTLLSMWHVGQTTQWPK
jgi:hypothetical protein